MKLFRLKDIREDHDYTQKEVADMLDVKRGTYASWECGTDIIPLKKLYKYANHFQKSIDYLLELTNKNIPIICTKDLDLKLISHRLKEIRKNLGLTQAQLSKSIGINQSTWWAYENGKTLITTHSLIVLSKISGCSVDKILGRK